MATEGSRPLLAPQTRRLRHLQGIYLRNLTLARPRGHTIDDATLNKTPEKLESLRRSLHEPSLQHSASSDDLNANIRPSGRRRRSTIWAGQSPDYRQRKLEDVIDNGMVDAFFSLHCAGEDEPIYISEVTEKAMNPNFRFFDLTNYGPSITRLSRFTIKLWVKRKEYSLFLEQEIELSSLHFLGSLNNRQLPPNCVIFHLIDGIYALDLPSVTLPPKHFPPVSTSSYSALMRLSSLDDSIQDALATRERLAAQINTILQEQPVDETPLAEEEAALAAKYLKSEQRLVKLAMKQRDELQASIAARRRAIDEGTKSQAQAEIKLVSIQQQVEEMMVAQKANTEQIHGQRRRICEELLHIFPIEPTARSLTFTICGLLLPNTSFDDSDEDVVAAALGHVARLVDMLQYYLSVPIPYPVMPYSSRSIVRDEISTLVDTQRTFPLYGKGTIRFRFEYAVFLLNKDIECLAESQGLKLIDIRHTLPNLKYLLYVCSAGTAELPVRKAGGIRGLLTGKVTPLPSRRGSEEGLADAARKALEHGSSANGGTKGNMSLQLPFDAETPTSLRTRGLRENRAR
ncbi:hypothetical protein VF21_04080 [Pseudogymnoascus sp. 05NY08]|nr:hypothetical protein VF21_04080 [Pseudogymnoascus sp. 05NY08]